MSLLKNSVYVRMLLAYGLSTVGDYLDYIALMIMIGYTWHLSPMVLAIYPMMYALPGMLFGQFSGVFADSLDKVKILVTCDVVRGLVTVFLLFAPNVWIAYPLLFIRGTAAVFNAPANQSLTRVVVPDEQLLKATTYNRAIFQFTKIFSPLLGGTLAALLSPRWCLVANVVSFAVSASILSTIRRTSDTGDDVMRQTEREPFVRRWKDGWSVILTRRFVLRSILFYLIGMIVIQIVESQYTTLFRDVAPNRMELRGWFTSSIGIGAFAAVMVLNRMNQLKKPGVVLGGGLFLEGAMCYIIASFTPTSSSLVPLTGGLLGGMGSGFLSTGFAYLIQRETPKESAGRVFGILSTLFNFNMIAGPLIGGAFVSSEGSVMTFRMTSYILLFIGLAGVVLQTFIWGKTVKQGMDAASGIVEAER